MSLRGIANGNVVAISRKGNLVAFGNDMPEA